MKATLTKQVRGIPPGTVGEIFFNPLDHCIYFQCKIYPMGIQVFKGDFKRLIK